MNADDTTLYQSGTNVSDIPMTLQTKLSSIRNWFKVNNIAINPLKTKCMLIGTANKIKSSSKLTIDNVALSNVTELKLLGIFIDQTLSWNTQVTKVRKD